MSKILITPQGFNFIRPQVEKYLVPQNEYIFTNGLITDSGKLCELLSDVDAVVIGSENIDEAIELINFIAPEHLELAFNKAEKYIDKIKNAGAIFIGHNTPEAVGDYVAGPNHVLPTNGTAKFSSGLSVLDFYKRTTVVKCNKKNLAIIGKHAVTLAKAEGLDAHAMSISLRIDK